MECSHPQCNCSSLCWGNGSWYAKKWAVSCGYFTSHLFSERIFMQKHQNPSLLPQASPGLRVRPQHPFKTLAIPWPGQGAVWDTSPLPFLRAQDPCPTDRLWGRGEESCSLWLPMLSTSHCPAISIRINRFFHAEGSDSHTSFLFIISLIKHFPLSAPADISGSKKRARC